MADDWNLLRWPGLAHVLITARDETSAYRVFDALVDRFPGVNAPCPRQTRPGLVVLSVITPTRSPDDH